MLEYSLCFFEQYIFNWKIKKYILKYYPELTLKNRLYFNLLLSNMGKKKLFYRIVRVERQ